MCRVNWNVQGELELAGCGNFGERLKLYCKLKPYYGALCYHPHCLTTVHNADYNPYIKLICKVSESNDRNISCILFAQVTSILLRYFSI